MGIIEYIHKQYKTTESPTLSLFTLPTLFIFPHYSNRHTNILQPP